MKKHTLKIAKILFAPFGYFLVSAFCILCGALIAHLSLSGDATKEISQSGITFAEFTYYTFNEFYIGSVTPIMASIVTYLIMIVVFFIVRELLFELPKEQYQKRANGEKHHIGAIWGIFLMVGTPLMFLGTQWQYNELPDAGDIFLRSCITLVASVVPFIVWICVSLKLLRSVDSDAQECAFRFPNRVYYPAIFTCLFSFLLGWVSFSSSITASIFFAITTIAVTAIYIFSITTKMAGGAGPTSIVSNLFFLFLLVAIPIVAQIPISGFREVSYALLFGIFVTMALGVSEVSKRVYMTTQGEKYYLEDEDADFYTAGANWSSLVFIPAVPLLSLLQPEIPVWFLAIYSAIYFLIVVMNSDKASYIYSWTSVILGFMLPIWIIIGTIIGAYYTNSITMNISSGVFRISAFGITATGVLLIIFNEERSKFREIWRTNIEYKQIDNALMLCISSCVTLLIYMFFLALFIEPNVGTPTLSSFKSTEIALFIFLVILAAVVTVILLRRSDDGSGGESQTLETAKAKRPRKRTRKDAGGAAKIAKFAREIGNMGRPMISLIAGLSTLVIISTQAVLSFADSVGVILTMTLITMYGFIVNDVFDVEKDTRGKRLDKSIVAGRISVMEAKLGALLIAMLSLSCALIAADALGLAVVFCLIVGLTYYSPFSNRFPAIKGIYTSILCISPLIFAEFFVGHHFVPSSLYLFAVAFFIGRELLFDAVDYESDKLSETHTIAVILGKNNSIYVAWITMIIAFAFLIPGASQMGVIASVLGILSLLLFWHIGRANLLLSSNLTRISVLFGLVSTADAIL